MKKLSATIFLTVLALFAKAQNPSNMTINQQAPAVLTKEIIITAAPEKVWAILTKIENWDEWNDRIKQPNLQGDLKVGSTFTWKTSGSKIKSKVHSLIPNKVLSWTGRAFGANAIHNWFLEPMENGTKVIVEESMEGWIVNLLKKTMNAKLADDMPYWLEQLKLESEK